MENDDDGDDSNENDLEISFTVNRILEDPNDSSDESDEVDDDDDDEDYYYYEDLTPERKEQLGMISHKKLLITIFGHIKNFNSLRF